MAVAYAELQTRSWQAVPDQSISLGEYIATEQERRNYSEERLAKAAGMTKTYVRLLKTLKGRNRDPEVKETEPSVRILRQLAEAFARGSRNPDEEEIIYGELMAAAGYLPRIMPGQLSAIEVEKAERLAEMQSRYIALSQALSDCERIIREASA